MRDSLSFWQSASETAGTAGWSAQGARGGELGRAPLRDQGRVRSSAELTKDLLVDSSEASFRHVWVERNEWRIGRGGGEVVVGGIRRAHLGGPPPRPSTLTARPRPRHSRPLPRLLDMRSPLLPLLLLASTMVSAYKVSISSDDNERQVSSPHLAVSPSHPRPARP